jgi:hypothetical protein
MHCRKTVPNNVEIKFSIFNINKINFVRPKGDQLKEQYPIPRTVHTLQRTKGSESHLSRCKLNARVIFRENLCSLSF